MSERIVVISDTHLGRPYCSASSATALRPLWQKADHFIVNGDVAEVHAPDHWAQAARELLHLFDLCDADGVQMTLLSGNHDPYISSHRYLHLEDNRVFITHGDAVHPAVAPWSPTASRIREAHDEALAALEPDKRRDLESYLAVTKHVSHYEWNTLRTEAAESTLWRMLIRPWAVAKVLWFWRIFPDLCAKFGQQYAPQARFLLFGHTHRSGIWHLRNRVVINTGSFGFPGRPRAAVIDDGMLSIWPIVLRRGEYQFGSGPVAWFALHEQPATGSDHVSPAPAPASTLNTRPMSGLRRALRT